MNNIIEARGISKTFYQGKNIINAVRDIDLTIERGESIAIVGPSGAGKSTLLHMLGGLDSPTTGSVIFNNSDIYRLSDTKRSHIRNDKIGFVFQFYNLLPEFNILENVMMPLLINGNKKMSKVAMENKAKMLLEQVGLERRLLHRPAELSGGEAQRVAIARALINDPDIIFCDEPTGNLDSNMGAQIYDTIYKLNEKEGMSIVIVTHHKDRPDLFNKTYSIKDGVIKNESKTSNLAGTRV